ncbi:MAG: CPBP family intramembrane glutamic endopeptidase [Anaerolineales bacterium]
MKSWFWNSEEGRLRAFWRIVIFLILYIVGMLALSCVGSLVFTLLMMVGRGDISNLQNLDPAQITAQSPYLFALNAVISLVVLAMALPLAAAFLDRRPLADYGFHLGMKWWLDLLFGLFLGAVLMLGIFLVERAVGWATVTGTFVYPASLPSFAVAILIPFVTYLAVGIYEEVLMRGYLLLNLAEGFNFESVGFRLAIVLAWILSSSIFALAHVFNPNSSLVSTLNLALAGLFLGLPFILTGDLAASIGLHITWNFFQGNVFGFPVSGMGSSTSFIVIEQAGPSAWTGGAFGPEAGWIGIGAILVGSLLTLLWVRLLRDRLELYRPLAVYTPREAPSGEGEAGGLVETEVTAA